MQLQWKCGVWRNQLHKSVDIIPIKMHNCINVLLLMQHVCVKMEAPAVDQCAPVHLGTWEHFVRCFLPLPLLQLQRSQTLQVSNFVSLKNPDNCAHNHHFPSLPRGCKLLCDDIGVSGVHNRGSSLRDSICCQSGTLLQNTKA